MVTRRLFANALMLTALVGTPAFAQYDPTADHCEFRSELSTFVHNNRQYPAGRINIDWSPGDAIVTKYEWYFDAWSKGATAGHHNSQQDPYSSLSGGFTSVDQNAHYSNALDVVLFEVIAATVGVPNNTVIGSLHPLGGGGAPDWVFNALLVQTGTSSIVATGQVQCR